MQDLDSCHTVILLWPQLQCSRKRKNASNVDKQADIKYFNSFLPVGLSIASHRLHTHYVLIVASVSIKGSPICFVCHAQIDSIREGV